MPNEIDTSKFTPDTTANTTTITLMSQQHECSITPSETNNCNDRIKIVVVSRLVHRKGVDSLVGTMPQECDKFPNADFIIGSDGSKRLSLEEIVKREQT